MSGLLYHLLPINCSNAKDIGNIPIDEKSSDETMLAININKVIESIYNDKLIPPSVRRIELRSAITDTIYFMKNKGLLDNSILFKKIAEIISSLGITAIKLSDNYLI